MRGVRNMASTEENLKAAFSGESMARNKYDYFAKQARKEGLIGVAMTFEETALNEMQHAKDEFKLTGGLGDTKANLRAAIEGEHYETSEMYPSFASQADKDGNADASRLFRAVAKVEAKHEERYKKILARLENGTLYKRDAPIEWKCSKCGYVHVGVEPPEKCPSCKHERGYYWPKNESDL